MSGVDTNSLGRAAPDTRVVIEQRVQPRNGAAFALGREVSDASARGVATGTPVLVALNQDASPGQTITASGSCVAHLPPSLPAAAALLAPEVACALSVWDRLRLELGETAVVTDDGEQSRVVATVASWYGALPVILVGTASGSAPAHVERFVVDDLSVATRELTARGLGRPGLAAAELTGRADLVGLLLETAPLFGRLLLAGAAREGLTVDFYTNVHRKGLQMFSDVLEPAGAIAPVWAGEPGQRLARAVRLLAHPARAAACRDALRGTAASPAGHP